MIYFLDKKKIRVTANGLEKTVSESESNFAEIDFMSSMIGIAFGATAHNRNACRRMRMEAGGPHEEMEPEEEPEVAERLMAQAFGNWDGEIDPMFAEDDPVEEEPVEEPAVVELAYDMVRIRGTLYRRDNGRLQCVFADDAEAEVELTPEERAQFFLDDNGRRHPFFVTDPEGMMGRRC